ncbi:PHD and RING finger domain-containing protein 1-like isoform X2 [Centropristis striata]|uniref:PHD and RING finger domain-containing protein 1-like isoform X2 n=1 Tax=Centropristis striata TaxID=184440 RepID=UPI0027DFD9B4|nr:PHD and RING finger domain-containing protein 1-like isoform X2 [Centropristis striata]
MDTPTVLNTTDDCEGADKCYICLSPFEKQTVASLDSCHHVFCLQCILQWSQRRCPGGDIQKKIKVRTKKKEDDGDDEEEGSNPVICEECGRSDRRHRLLVCIQCDTGYHMDCLTPPLNTGPEGDWICPECVVTPQNTDSFMVEGEISDGEVTDLLAEVDETASTSSRLRPSTINRPSSSTERRHSQRIQSRVSIDPHPRPQTSWHVPKYLLRASKPAVATDVTAALHHSETSGASVKLKTRKRKKRAT